MKDKEMKLEDVKDSRPLTHWVDHHTTSSIHQFHRQKKYRRVLTSRERRRRYMLFIMNRCLL